MTAGEIRIGIVGAGIGGLTIAPALRQRRLAADVYEQSSELRKIGAAVIARKREHENLSAWDALMQRRCSVVKRVGGFVRAPSSEVRLPRALQAKLSMRPRKDHCCDAHRNDAGRLQRRSKEVARHPAYADLAYQPMLEVMTYFRADGYKTFIVTGSGFRARVFAADLRHPARAGDRLGAGRQVCPAKESFRRDRSRQCAAWDLAGGRAVYTNNDIGRIFPDILVATRHVTQNLDINATDHGRRASIAH